MLLRATAGAMANERLRSHSVKPPIENWIGVGPTSRVWNAGPRHTVFQNRSCARPEATDQRRNLLARVDSASGRAPIFQYRSAGRRNVPSNQGPLSRTGIAFCPRSRSRVDNVDGSTPQFVSSGSAEPSSVGSSLRSRNAGLVRSVGSFPPEKTVAWISRFQFCRGSSPILMLKLTG